MDTHRYFDLAHDMLVISSMDGDVLAVNDAWTELLGWRREQLVGRPFYEFVHPEDQDASAAAIDFLRRKPDEVYRVTNRYRSTAGTYRWIEWRARRAPNQEVLYGAGRDVTEAIHLRDRLHARERALLRVLDELAGSRDAEQQRIAAELHDTSVQHAAAARMYVDAALQQELPPPTRRALEAALEQVRDCIASTRRIMQGLDPLGLGGIPFDSALRELATDARRQFGLDVDASCELPVSPHDEVAGVAYRAVREALVNAGKHARATHVMLDAKSDHDELTVTVADDGRGLAAAGSERRDGGGFGLHLLAERVRRAGGTFSITSGRSGTTVCVTLPIAPTGDAHDQHRHRVTA